MAWNQARAKAAERLGALIQGTREALGDPELTWIVSQQPPPTHEWVEGIDVVEPIVAMAAADKHLWRVDASGLGAEGNTLVMGAAGVVALGQMLAEAWIEQR